MISISEIHIYTDSESCRQIHGKIQEEQTFWCLPFGKMEIMEIWPFLWHLEGKMVNLSPIDFQIGLSPNINVHDGQNNFEVHIAKNMANFRTKIGQDANLVQGLTWAALSIWTQNHSQVVDTCLGHFPNSQLKIDLPKVLGLNPP